MDFFNNEVRTLLSSPPPLSSSSPYLSRGSAQAQTPPPMGGLLQPMDKWEGGGGVPPLNRGGHGGVLGPKGYI